MNTKIPILTVRSLPSQYDNLAKLGEGGFAKVFSADDKKTGKKVAIKIEKKPILQETPKETEILTDLKDCPFVVKIIEAYEINKKKYIIMEYINGETLEKYLLNKTEIISETEIAIIAWNVASALYEMHEYNNTIHRDVKPGNIMICKSENHVLGARLLDFNISKKYKKGVASNTQCGTEGFRAPEIFQKNYDEKVDVWSYGIILYLFFAQKKDPIPQLNDFELKDKISKGEEIFTEHSFNNCSPNLLNLIKNCLKINPTERLSMSDVLEHPWFTNHITIKQRTEESKQFIELFNDNTRSTACWKDPSSGKVYSVLCYKDYRNKLNNNTNKLLRGIHIWKYLQLSEYIPKLFDYFEIRKDLFILRENIDAITLREKIKQYDITATELILIAKQLADAIKDMHRMHICHRGLSPDSIECIEGKDSKIIIKEFDFARSSYKNEITTPTTTYNVYIAPEYAIPNTSKVLYESDIWSYGMILFFINYKEDPDKINIKLNRSFSIYKIYTEGLKLPENKQPILSEINQLILECVESNWEKRSKIKNIINRLSKIS